MQKYRRSLGLGKYHYEVRFLSGPEVADYYAEASITRGNVILCFNEDLMRIRPASIEDTVVHELLHVLLDKLMSKSENIVRRHVVKKKVQQRLTNRMEKLEHAVIDKLANALLRGR